MLIPILLTAIAIARWGLAPSLWWCVVNEIGRTKRARCEVIAIAFIPHVFALLWLAEAASFYQSGIGAVLAAPCFCWARAVQLPTVVTTQKWTRDIQRRLSGLSGLSELSCNRKRNSKNKYEIKSIEATNKIVACLVVAGYLQLLWDANTWRGFLGICLWARGARGHFY